MRKYFEVLAAATLIALTIVPDASARERYAAYDGPDAVRAGQGGTKFTKHGVDYWTTGSPPRRFKVLGVITDARTNRGFNGDVVGSGSVAKLVHENGGDAVVLISNDPRVPGSTGGMPTSLGQPATTTTSHGPLFARRTTQLLVIRYLTTDR